LIELHNLSFNYSDTLIVDSLNLKLEDNQIVTIMGHSGCGKSTVLRLIAGLEKPSSGSYFINGNSNSTSIIKNMRFAFQDYDAFPWMTVYKNMLLGGAVETNIASDSFTAL